ncbi:MAG: ribosome-associated translation inhibitor RaiA [Lachnospiraceae bacterium]|nr:ribosome-associated translation inhibitor RaiA [Lachnospiraceae bacterium]MBR3165180.1 ribosome-associated translation inhibitor RaiA [Lachnospiraceae bacterium]
MRFRISGKNIQLTDNLQNQVEHKLAKLDKYFKGDPEVQVTLSTERELQKVEVTIPIKGTVIRAEESSSDMYASIDLVQESIIKQLRRHKSKLIDRYQSGFTPTYTEESVEDEDAIRIVRTKHFALKPMDPEEACLQMELLGHSFYVFRDSMTEQVCVVYKRKDGAYGLIEPEG